MKTDRILFVYKGRYHVRDTVTLEYLSSIARGLGFQTSLAYDPDLFGLTDNVFFIPFLNRVFSAKSVIHKKIRKSQPQIVIFLDGFNRSLWNAQISQGLKEKGCGAVRVLSSHGPDAASLSKDYDYVVNGEPEVAVENFLKNKIFGRDKGIYDFKGLADLDQLPLPDKGLFHPYVDFRDSYMIYSSKGCPYHCSYCEETVYQKTMQEGYFRRRRPENVILELEKAKREFGAREVIYKDSVFAMDKAWLEPYLALYKKQIDLPYKCFAKESAFDDEMASLLKESGCYCVEFGVQTFNERLKQSVLDREEKAEVLLKAFSVCEKHGLSYDADHLFGIPGEQLKDHLDAAKIYLGLKTLNRIKCHNLVFYPQAPITRHAPVPLKQDKGYQADFFSVVAGEGQMRWINKNFEKYFKVLPLLTRRINLFILKGNRWKGFVFIPYGFITILMLVLGAKKRDRRFAIYGRLYLRKLLTGLTLRSGIWII